MISDVEVDLSKLPPRSMWDREMDAMSDKYENYANEKEEEGHANFRLDPIDDEMRACILEGRGAGALPALSREFIGPPAPQPAVGISAARGVGERVSVARMWEVEQEWNGEGFSCEPTKEDMDWLAVQSLHETRESAIVALVRNRANDVIDEKHWRKGIEARAQLNEDSTWIAQMLHVGGEKGFKPAHAPRAAILDLLSGMIFDLPHTVGKNFIPCEAAKKRAKMLISAEHWCEQHRLDRFWVMHGPGRVPCEDLRETFKVIHRKISKLNAEPFMKIAGVRLNLRISEVGGLTFMRLRSSGAKIEDIVEVAADGRKNVRLFGRKGLLWVDAGEIETVEHRDEVGRWSYYPHVNILAHFSKGKIDNTPGPVDPKTNKPAPSTWQKFLSDVHAFWEWGWQECGGLDDIREAIKYAAKPADLRRMTAPDICDLARAMHRLHLAQPLGLLKNDIKSRREYCLKLCRWRNRRTGTLVIREKPDWNARKRNRIETEAEKDRKRARLKHRLMVKRLALEALTEKKRETGTFEQQSEFCVSGHFATELALPPTPIVSKVSIQTTQPPTGPKPLIRNRVVARMVGTSPAFPRVGPQLLVWGFEMSTEAERAASLKAVMDLPFVAPLVEAARLKPDAIRVHTSPVTVRGLAFDTAEAWSKPPDPGEN